MASLNSYAYLDLLRQYKRDTNWIARWLASQARKYGLPSNQICASISTNSGCAATMGESTRHTLRVKYFINLAKHHVKFKGNPSPSVPTLVLDMVTSVIAAREKIAAMYEALPDTERDFEANKGHRHFIAILKVVKQILSKLPRSPEPPKKTRSAMPATDSAQQSTHEASFQNRFAELLVEGSGGLSDADDEGEEMYTTTPVQEKAKETYEVDSEDLIEEKAFAYICLIYEVNLIRDRVFATWFSTKYGQERDRDLEQHRPEQH
jgi:hypothetical protein